MWKQIIIWCFVILGCIGGYSFVSGWNLVFNPEIQFVTSVGKDVYTDSDNLHTMSVVYKSNINIKNATISSLCTISSRFIEETKGLYFFEVDYSEDRLCANENIVLQMGDQTYANTISQLSLMSDADIYSLFVDYSDQQLREYNESLKKDLDTYSVFKNYNKNNIWKYYKFFAWQRKYQELTYKKNIITDIIEGRWNKYISPVPGRRVVETAHKIPNAPRPYRDAYTDGVHHAWDIDGELWETVVALDDGVIVRIVDDFTDEDFSKIDYSAGSSYETQLNNLDILRGNQVWLKTLKWEVVFYSHLESVDQNIRQGMLVKKSTPFGKMWVTGVPEVGYDDYHLHFSIMENPHDILRAGTYSFMDYMSWDWLTRWKTYNQVVQEQNNIFE